MTRVLASTAFLITLILLCLAQPPARAQSCALEKEPNDQPDAATPFPGGCLTGTIGEGDAQDLWAWTLTEPGEQWQLTLVGVDGALTNLEILRVRRDAQGRITGADSLYQLGGVEMSVASAPLLLTADDYLLGVTASSAGEYRVDVAPVPLPSASEAEPNDTQDNGTPVAGEFAVTGVGDTDYFTWTLDQQAAAQRWELTLRVPLGANYTFQLLDAQHATIMARNGASAGVQRLHDLGLAAGTYLLRIWTNTPSTYTLAARSMGDRMPGLEEEPNGRDQPNVFTDGMRGRLDEDGAPQDHYLLETDPAWAGRQVTLKLTGGAGKPRTLCLLTVQAVELSCRTGRVVTLPNLDLDESAYLVRVGGVPAPDQIYQLALNVGSDFRPADEREPNDALAIAAVLPESGAVRGQFVGQETDFYRFTTSGDPQLWRVQLSGHEGATLGDLAVYNARGDEVALLRNPGQGDLLRLSRVYLLPGTHVVAARGADGPYTLRLLSQGKPDPNIEEESNDTANTALPLAFGQRRRGLLPFGDVDQYRFRLTARELVRLTVTPPADGVIRLQFAPSVPRDAIQQGDQSGTPTVFEGWLLPDDYTVELRPQGASDDAYNITLERLNPFLADHGSDPGVEAALSFNRDDPAAYSTWSQQIDGVLRLTNTGAAARTLRLESHLSDATWVLSWDEPIEAIAPGTSVNVPVTLTLPPDAWADVPIVVTVAAFEANADDADALTTAMALLTPSRTAEPAAPTFGWTVPEPLLGSLDAAASALGATILTEDADLAARQAVGLERFAPDGDHESFWFSLNSHPLPQTLTVDLAGEDAVAVSGFALHPQGEAGTAPTVEQIREFEVRLSLDGETYETVLSAELAPSRVEQFFELAEPVNARFAQLVLLGTQGPASRARLDGWKVLVAPDALTGERNLADPALGGRLVRWNWQFGFNFDFAADASPLTEGAAPWPVGCFRGCPDVDFVVGLHKQRAAQLGRIEWVEGEVAGDGRLERVEVWVSAETPVGPWTPVGALAIADAPFGTHVLELQEPIVARYVRFVIPTGDAYDFTLPATVRLIERPVDATYRSILGEWGWQSAESSREWAVPPVYVIDPIDDTDSPDDPLPLGDGASGRVQLGRDEDFYRVTVPGEANTLRLTVTGQSTVGVELALQDAAGRALPLALDEVASSPARTEWVAFVAPGAEYVVRVFEPPRSIIFAWDTSGSIAPFRPMIFQALARFAATVTPGLEAVNLLPFEGGLLLDRWEDEPTLIWQAIQDFSRDTASSATAETLLDATEALAARQGARAVVLIGDMELADQPVGALWDALDVVQPHVFVLRVAYSGLTRRSHTHMSSWAMVNDGEARETPTVGSLAVGFDRAATRLRQPAAYALSAETSFSEPPGPGFLRVVSQLVERADGAEQAVLGDTSVEIILDASGSMQQPIDGRRRIDVARETLIDLTTTILPAETPVALRVFGHIEGNLSCRTDLVQPLAPLDPATIAATLAAIEPQDRANTALASSLRLAAEDLADAPGQKVLILVTDGEETCGGDPALEISRLREMGLDVRVNIVGFAIDDAALKAEFASWAAIGGGSYFDAADPAELNEAIRRAVRVPFRVLSSDGDIVAVGSVNGDPVSLPAGVYAVEVAAEPLIRVDNVVIVGEREATLVVR